jgi:hypothetical protein
MRKLLVGSGSGLALVAAMMEAGGPVRVKGKPVATEQAPDTSYQEMREQSRRRIAEEREQENLLAIPPNVQARIKANEKRRADKKAAKKAAKRNK